MNVAFKEWAVVVDALGRGEQIFILRKGGIHEGRGGFAIEHSSFLLFPTRFHQQRDAVIASAQARFDQLEPKFPPADTLRLEYWCNVVEWHELTSESAFEALRGQHIWRDEVLRERFDWGKSRGIFAIAVRVFRLPRAIDLPLRAEYGGCKSWVTIERELDRGGSAPVLDDAPFHSKLERFRQSLVQLASA